MKNKHQFLGCLDLAKCDGDKEINGKISCPEKGAYRKDGRDKALKFAKMYVAATEIVCIVAYILTGIVIVIPVRVIVEKNC